MLLQRASKGKLNHNYTRTGIQEFCGVYLVITVYFQDAECSEMAHRQHDIYSFIDQEEAENFYEGMSQKLWDNLKKELK